ncbi:MAG TPA: hypothetical protein VFH99_04465 [Candidatus Saccharimonadales bacterium]|nr:hypothetical protein [Candidatus Saccharimonadales bacterium]
MNDTNNAPRRPVSSEILFNNGVAAGTRAEGSYDSVKPETLYEFDELQRAADKEWIEAGRNLLDVCELRAHIWNEASHLEIIGKNPVLRMVFYPQSMSKVNPEREAA